MCGIIGTINKNDEAYAQTVLGLMSLQHRGQDACGIVTDDGTTLHLKKEMDSVARVFKKENAKDLPGKAAIGHTRYATAGKGNIQDAQPILAGSTPDIALIQNGNVSNYFSLKKSLKEQGIEPVSSVDTELIQLTFVKAYEEKQDFFAAAKEVLSKVQGGYSIVGVIAGQGIFAIRDPRGIRPLVLGKANGSSYMFASETVTFQKLGYEFMQDVKPGEAIFISEDFEIESRILMQEEHAHCMFEWVYLASPNSMIDGRAVYKSRLALGRLLAEHVNKDDIDILMPVPDSGRTAAIKLAEVGGLRYREGLIKDRYVSRTFIMPSQRTREEAVERKLVPIISMVKDKRIGLVDDSIVRGTTSKKLVQLLKEADVSSLTFISTCPPIKHPCFYGVSMSTEEELIASKRDIEAIRKHLGADHLIYAEVEDIKKAIRRSVCTACLTGDYPVPISDEERTQIAEQRAKEDEAMSDAEVQG